VLLLPGPPVVPLLSPELVPAPPPPAVAGAVLDDDGRLDALPAPPLPDAPIELPLPVVAPEPPAVAGRFKFEQAVSIAAARHRPSRAGVRTRVVEAMETPCWLVRRMLRGFGACPCRPSPHPPAAPGALL
jgi:hypothetical protein